MTIEKDPKNSTTAMGFLENQKLMNFPVDLTIF